MSAITGSARHARPSPRPWRALSWVASAVVCALTGCGLAALAAYGYLAWPARALTVTLLAVIIVSSPEAVRQARSSLWKRRLRRRRAAPVRGARGARRALPARRAVPARRGSPRHGHAR